MKTKLIALLILLFGFNQIQAQSQLPYPINIQSPNAANLGKYGDVPMNLYTGTPNISIPLMTMNDRNQEMNIYLNYDASGVRIQSHPSWVGQNWTLNAGGVITRSVQNYEDECPWKTVTSAALAYQKGGFFKTLGASQYATDNQSITNFCHYDCQPDIFTFNFMGKTGKFFMDNDGSWRVQSDMNIEVIFDKLDDNNFGYPPLYSSGTITGPKTIQGFILRDEEGNVYMFGYVDTAIEYSIDFFYQHDGSGDPSSKYFPSKWIANAWYLTTVLDKYGNNIYNLEYARGKYIAEFFQYYQKTSFYYNNVSEVFPGSDLAAQAKSYGQWGGNLISPVYLSKIRCDNSGEGLVAEFISSDSYERPYHPTNMYGYNNISVTSFPLGTVGDESYSQICPTRYRYPYLQNQVPGVSEYLDQTLSQNTESNPISGLRWRKLDAIKLFHINEYMGNYIHLKTIQFQYNDGRTSQSERLCLTKVDFQAKNTGEPNFPVQGEKEYSYTLSYEDFLSLPDYLSTKTDHWGFYNGITSSIDNPNGRAVNETFAKKGSLTKIIYPTGGNSIFSYEANRYNRVYSNGNLTILSGVSLAGGLRINTITNFDGEETVIKKYYYGESSIPVNISLLSPVGILKAIPTYNYSWGGAGLNFTKESYTSIVPLSNSFGTHIEYPVVIESSQKANDNSGISSTVFRYTQKNDGSPYDYYEGPVQCNTSLDFMRGKLCGKNIYDTYGKLKESTEIVYRSMDPSFLNQVIDCSNFGIELATPGTTVRVINGENVPIPVFASSTVGGSYGIYYGRFDAISENHLVYSDNDENNEEMVQFTKTYDRRDLDIDIASNVYSSRASVANVRYLYSESQLNSDNIEHKKMFRYPWDMTGENYMINLQNQFRIGPVSTETYNAGTCIGKEKWTYKSENNYIVPGAWFKSKTDLQYGRPTIIFNKYDEEGDLLCFTKNNGLTTTILWDKILIKPALLVENMSYDFLLSVIGESGVQSFENRDIGEIGTLITTLRNLGKNYRVTNYNYTLTGNIDWFTMPNSKGLKYTYDSMDRLSSTRTYDDKLLEELDYNYRPTPCILGQ